MYPLRTCRNLLAVSLCAGVLASNGQTDDPPVAKPIATSLPVQMRVDVSKNLGEMKPVWRFFGHDEPNYTYMKDGKKLLAQLAAMSAEPVYIRTHNLLTSGDGTPALKWGSTGVYSEDAEGRPHYDWTILDRIFDTYKERGVRPYVQIGFMPEALSTRPEPYQHQWTPGGRASISTGWAYPPKDYEKWGELVFQWVKHAIDRYGRDEVDRWYWEVWNEPNIFYWRGKPEEYHKLYDYSVDAVKRALPSARVGGPHQAGARSPQSTKYLRDFLDHCLSGTNYVTGKKGSPVDFVSFHAKGNPQFTDSHVRMGIGAQLQEIDRGFEIVAGYPELKGKPIVIGESDPDGCAACPSTIYPQNGYRNGTLYASYTAASFARKYLLADRHGVNFEGAVTWAFEFEDQPYFAGFRVLSSNGIALPVLNVFRMFGQMSGHRVAVISSADLGLDSIRRSGVRGPSPDVSAIATRSDHTLCVLMWHYHDDDVAGPDADVSLAIDGLTGSNGPVLLEEYRIDRDHSNAFETWKTMGSPAKPSPEQQTELERSAELALLRSPEWVKPHEGKIELRVTLPRQAVALVVLRGDYAAAK
jgi:xylan 1,4-beta-xylosidase